MRRCDAIRLAASTSFNEAEVKFLDELLSRLLRSADVVSYQRRPEVGTILKKVGSMKESIERKRAMRAELAGEIGTKDSGRDDGRRQQRSKARRGSTPR